MNSELIPVHLGEDRVQMHERTHIRNVQHKNPLNRTGLILKQPACKKLNSFRRSTLGKTDREQIFSEIQDVPSFNMKGIAPVVIKRNLPCIIRMEAHNEITVNCFPAAGNGIHSVKAYSVSYACEGITCKIQVWYGIQHKLPALSCQVCQRSGTEFIPHFFRRHTAHGFQHKLAVIRQGCEHVKKLFFMVLCKGTAFAQKQSDKNLPQSRIGFQSIRHQILKIDDLCSLPQKDRSECIVLLPGKRQIRDIVKEQSLQFLRNKVLQLFTGAMEQYFFQCTNLVFYTDCHRQLSLSFRQKLLMIDVNHNYMSISRKP